ncbi:MAG: hypothetical protein JO052_12260, partial [Bradyrhizobium sp.]|nr:hypothetical protein [Bradyrhizobium sp.]
MSDIALPMTRPRNRAILRAAVTLIAVALLYEALARSGIFPAVLLPTIPSVLTTLYDMIRDGTMELHALYTLYRVLF